MTEHNINEVAPAALALPALAGKAAGIAGKASKVIGAAKGAGKVAKRAAGALSANSEGIGTTSGRVSEEVLDEDILNEFQNPGSTKAPATTPQSATQRRAQQRTSPTRNLQRSFNKPKPATSSGSGTRSLTQRTTPTPTTSTKPTVSTTPTTSTKPTGARGLNPFTAAAEVIGADIMKGRTATAKETKPGELGSMDWAGKVKSKESGPGWSRTKPEKKPLPTKADLVTRKPSRDYQAEKEAQKDAETDTKTDTETDTKTDTGVGSKVAAGAAAAGVGAAAAAALKGKMKLGMPGADKDPGIGKTKARVNFKARQTEEQLEVICDYLLDEGYASTGVEAENIYTHMSEEWKQYIVNS